MSATNIDLNHFLVQTSKLWTDFMQLSRYSVSPWTPWTSLRGKERSGWWWSACPGTASRASRPRMCTAGRWRWLLQCGSRRKRCWKKSRDICQLGEKQPCGTNSRLDSTLLMTFMDAHRWRHPRGIQCQPVHLAEQRLAVLRPVA